MSDPCRSLRHDGGRLTAPLPRPPASDLQTRHLHRSATADRGRILSPSYLWAPPHRANHSQSDFIHRLAGGGPPGRAAGSRPDGRGVVLKWQLAARDTSPVRQLRPRGAMFTQSRRQTMLLPSPAAAAGRHGGPTNLRRARSCRR